MYSTFPNWTMMGPISFWVSDVSKVFLEDLHDQMSKMKSNHQKIFFNIPCLQSRRSPYFISSRVFIHNLILDPNRLYKTSGFKSQRDWYLNQTYNSKHTMETNNKSMGNIPTLHFTMTTRKFKVASYLDIVVKLLHHGLNGRVGILQYDLTPRKFCQHIPVSALRFGFSIQPNLQMGITKHKKNQAIK